MIVNSKCKYVLLSVKWTKNGHCLFWGRLPDDNEKRSYSGYTMDLNECERYTREEAFFSKDIYEYNGERFGELVQKDSDGTLAITLNDLSKLGQKKTILWV